MNVRFLRPGFFLITFFALTLLDCRRPGRNLSIRDIPPEYSFLGGEKWDFMKLRQG